MANVLVLSAAPSIRADDETYNIPYRRFLACAELDRFGVHRRVHTPEDADIILFVEYRPAGRYLHDTRAHRFVSRWRERCFVYCSEDAPIPFLPGIYPSLEQRFASQGRTRGGHYLRRLGLDPLGFDPDAWSKRPTLFSFLGRRETHALRGRLGQLDHPRGVIIDSGAEFRGVEGGRLAEQPYWQRYSELLRDSAFVLCPRGYGASSLRIFEAMRHGRTPVILSDDWQPPTGPDWSRCAIRVPEADWRSVPQLLTSLEPRAAELGRAARAAWLTWFSPEVTFHRLVEACLDIQATRRVPERVAQLRAWAHCARPRHAWPYAREVLIRRGVSDLGKRLLRPSS